jgi:hypothetical protein
MSRMARLEPRRAPLHEYRCCGCGYGVRVRILPEHCPMCRGSTWEWHDVHARRGRVERPRPVVPPEADPPEPARIPEPWPPPDEADRPDPQRPPERPERAPREPSPSQQHMRALQRPAAS